METQSALHILPADLDDTRVIALLEHHTATARAATAPGSAHALDLAALRSPDLQLWAAWLGDTLVGVGALKTLTPEHGELKSMHIAATARGHGLGSSLLQHLLDQARQLGLRRVSLETGSWPYFEPARALYRRHGFSDTGPFAQYVDDPNSCFMTRQLDA